ncbi:NAD-dependent epimerase/dehydratase family protein [Streptococcus suis]|nr:NAD-dependent epimerase/dehydratase family protein [Streptococcus suis]
MRVDYKKFFNTSILITGANGLIGGTLLDFFLFLNSQYQANISLTVLVRQHLEIHNFFNDQKINEIIQSVADPIFCEYGLDYIFHVASNAHPRAYDLYPVETILTTVLGTRNALELAKEKNAKLLFVSSSEVYGELPKGLENHMEDNYGNVDILSPRSCYSESKRLAETLVVSYVKEHNIHANIVRPSYIYGARFSEKNTRADVDFIKRCLSKKDIVLKSEGTQLRSYCYVLDCISAMLIVSLNGKLGEAYNISSDSGNVQLVEFARTLAETVGVKLIFDIQSTSSGSPVHNSLLSNQKLKSLGWQELFELSEGVCDTFRNILI